MLLALGVWVLVVLVVLDGYRGRGHMVYRHRGGRYACTLLVATGLLVAKDLLAVRRLAAVKRRLVAKPGGGGCVGKERLDVFVAVPPSPLQAKGGRLACSPVACSQHMVSTWLAHGQHTVGARSEHGRNMVSTRSAHGQHMGSTWPAHGQQCSPNWPAHHSSSHNFISLHNMHNGVRYTTNGAYLASGR